MSVRNYHAFIKAARKTGGLSLPAARKTYQKMKARLDRAPKGTDVKKHPRIFKASIPAKRGRPSLIGGLSKIRQQTGKVAGGSNKRSSQGKAGRGSSGRVAVGRIPNKPQPSTRGMPKARRESPAKERAARPSRVVVNSLEDLYAFLDERAEDLALQEDSDEYVSTVEYKKK
jgi:hypothetical protein